MSFDKAHRTASSFARSDGSHYTVIASAHGFAAVPAFIADELYPGRGVLTVAPDGSEEVL